MLNECMNCKQEIKEEKTLGICIENFCIDLLPAKIIICKKCSEEIAINFISGKLPNFKMIGSLFSRKGKIS